MAAGKKDRFSMLFGQLILSFKVQGPPAKKTQETLHDWSLMLSDTAQPACIRFAMCLAVNEPLFTGNRIFRAVRERLT